jgi:toxin-antitoxin system PIN domain toxin
MRAVDVNVLVYALRDDAERHDEYRDWLDTVRRGPEPLGLADVVVSGFVRVVTHPKVFRTPTRLSIAFDFVESLRTSPAVVPIAPGARHWSVFTDLCRATEARGNDAPDAFLAAIAIENGATWCSADRGFSRYPTLRWEHPLDG